MIIKKRCLFNLMLCWILAVAAASPTQAETVQLDDYWNGTAGNLPSAFTAAIDAAGDGGTIQLSAQTYESGNTISIHRPVTIEGAGRESTVVKLTVERTNFFFRTDADDVTFRDLTLDGDQLTERVVHSQGYRRLSAYGVGIENSRKKGIWGRVGEALHGLHLEDCVLHNNADVQVLICNRKWDVIPLPSIDTVTVKNCVFSGTRMRDLIMDAGNDENNFVTDMSGSEYINNQFLRGGKWHTGTVQASNYSIVGNLMEGPDATIQTFAHVIHIEQLCNNIQITDNILMNTGNDIGTIIWMGEGKGPPQTGPNNITIARNTFVGENIQRAITAYAIDDNLIEANDFSNVIVSDGGDKIRLFAGKYGMNSDSNTVRWNLGLDCADVSMGGVDNTCIPPVLGDFSLDGDVDLEDLDRYIGNIGAAAPGDLELLDLDGDGVVGANDFQRHYADLVETSNGGKGTFAGDLNLDGTVDVLGDAVLLVNNLGNSANSWADGDVNGDGTVDVLGDAVLLISNLGNSNGGDAEPSSLSLTPFP